MLVLVINLYCNLTSPTPFCILLVSGSERVFCKERYQFDGNVSHASEILEGAVRSGNLVVPSGGIARYPAWFRFVLATYNRSGLYYSTAIKAFKVTILSTELVIIRISMLQ